VSVSACVCAQTCASACADECTLFHVFFGRGVSCMVVLCFRACASFLSTSTMCVVLSLLSLSPAFSSIVQRIMVSGTQALPFLCEAAAGSAGVFLVGWTAGASVQRLPRCGPYNPHLPSNSLCLGSLGTVPAAGTSALNNAVWACISKVVCWSPKPAGRASCRRTGRIA